MTAREPRYGAAPPEASRLLFTQRPVNSLTRFQRSVELLCSTRLYTRGFITVQHVKIMRLAISKIIVGYNTCLG
jgi:hypothetical protein